MNSKKAIILPKYQKIFDSIGENIKLARKRRKLTTEQVNTCFFNVLKVLNLEDDFSKIARDDEFGRKLQDYLL